MKTGRLLFVLSAIFLISFVYVPDPEPAVSLCVIKHFLGIPCPGCGLTHSFCALSHGHFLESFQWHALGPPIYFILLAVWLGAFLRFFKLRTQSVWSEKLKRHPWGKAFLVVLFVHWTGCLVWLLYNP